MKQNNRIDTQIKKLMTSIFEIDINSDSLFNSILLKIRKHIKFDEATCYLFNKNTEQLQKIESLSRDVELLNLLSTEIGSGLSSWSADSAQSILLADRTKRKDFDPENEFASFLSVPIYKNEDLYGVLNFGSYTKDTFTKDDLKLVESISDILVFYYRIYTDSRKISELEKSCSDMQCQHYHNISQTLPQATVESISVGTSEVIHGINNSLSIILGNLQCLLIGASEFNQKTLSRLKRIEVAAKKISDSNNKILKLNSLVDTSSNSNVLKKV